MSEIDALSSPQKKKKKFQVEIKNTKQLNIPIIQNFACVQTLLLTRQRTKS